MSKPIVKPQRNYTTLFWKVFIGFLLFIILFLTLLGFGIISDMPSFEELENPKSMLSAEVYSADGKLMGKYYKQNRSLVSYKNLPTVLVDALVATEDERFLDHSGIDARAIGRAVKGIFTPQNEGGASTLTQQLAKNLFPRDRNLNKAELILQKLKEWIIAVRLEKKYTKQELITMYFNTVDFVNTATGIKSASQVYFNTSVDSLNVEQSALLVGMVQNPNLFNPVKRAERAQVRRNIVYRQMIKNNKLTQNEYEKLKDNPINLDYHPALPEDGIAPYFREHVRQEVKDWCKKHKNPKTGDNYDLYQDGLRIYTSIDSRMQVYAEEAVKIHIKSLQKSFNVGATAPNKRTIEDGIKHSLRYKALIDSGKTEGEINKIFDTPTKIKYFSWEGEKSKTMTPKDSVKYYEKLLHAGFMAMDPTSGMVKAWVGGISFKDFQYDHVNPNSKRQVGSTFKPFVYSVYIDNGFSPCQRVIDRRYCIGSWCPNNSDGGFSGASLTLKQALTKSKNSISAFLMLQVKPDPVISLIKRMGIDVSNFKRDATICLGTQDISVLEMVGAYSTFANRGIYSKPVYITRIEDKSGNVLDEFRSDKVEVMSQASAYIMTNMMESVVDFGTAKRLRSSYGFKVDLAGKTGTTDNNSDGWFMGYTPRLVAGAWVGADNRQVHFISTSIGQGASTALPIWAIFMKKVYADKKLGYSQNEKFEKPNGEMPVELDCNKYYESETLSGENIPKQRSSDGANQAAEQQKSGEEVEYKENGGEFEQ